MKFLYASPSNMLLWLLIFQSNKMPIVGRTLLACGEYGGDIGQISRHTSSYSSFPLHLHCPLNIKQSSLPGFCQGFSSNKALLIRASCFPHGGTFDISSGRGEEIIFRGQACVHHPTQNQSACFYGKLGLEDSLRFWAVFHFSCFYILKRILNCFTVTFHNHSVWSKKVPW